MVYLLNKKGYLCLLQGKIGFLSIENRVCVALSRAKKGLYCIGNANVSFELCRILMYGYICLLKKLKSLLHPRDYAEAR